LLAKPAAVLSPPPAELWLPKAEPADPATLNAPKAEAFVLAFALAPHATLD
jgi:hypothetical protein